MSVFHADFAAARRVYDEAQPRSYRITATEVEAATNDLADRMTTAFLRAMTGGVPRGSIGAGDFLYMGADGLLTTADGRRIGEPRDPEERNNAIRLLETVVGEETMKNFNAGGRIRIPSPTRDGFYILKEGGMTYYHASSISWAWFCYELPSGYHPIDKMVAEILMIQTDEKKYLEIANVQGEEPENLPGTGIMQPVRTMRLHSTAIETLAINYFNTSA